MKSYAKILAMSLALTIPAAGYCGDNAPAKTPDAGAAAKPATAFGEAAQSVVPKVSPSMESLAVEASSEISGTVIETMDSGGYSYALLDNKGKKTWVAMPETKVVVGMELTFSGGGEMVDFRSASLKRTFDKIWFCGAPIKVAGAGTIDGKKSPGSEGAVPAVKETIKVEKAAAENAYKVAELYAKSASLDKKTIVVKGKVVKVSAGIMAKNWVHIQDGSGDAKTKTNNLVVTTQDLPKVGDVVTASGTLYKDKDFGGGYKYDVIVEEATITP